MSHVFVSYVRDNEQEVSRLCDRLRDHGVDVWLDREKIEPGQRWKQAIRGAIQKGAFFIACFSKEYNDRVKNYMNEELTLAIDEIRQRSTNRAWFIPVILNKFSNVPDRVIGAGESLRDLQWVDLSEDWEGGFRKLLSSLVPKKDSRFDKLLIDAIQSRDLDLVETFVRSGADVNYENHGNSPLYVAGFFGNASICKVLVDAGADVAFTDRYGSTPLMHAAEAGKVDILEYLCGLNIVPIESFDITKKTALYYAVEIGNYDSADFLLQKGANPNVVCSQGRSMLYMALFNKNINKTRLLGSSAEFVGEIRFG